MRLLSTLPVSNNSWLNYLCEAFARSESVILQNPKARPPYIYRGSRRYVEPRLENTCAPPYLYLERALDVSILSGGAT